MMIDIADGCHQLHRVECPPCTIQAQIVRIAEVISYANPKMVEGYAVITTLEIGLSRPSEADSIHVIGLLRSPCNIFMRGETIFFLRRSECILVH